MGSDSTVGEPFRWVSHECTRSSSSLRVEVCPQVGCRVRLQFGATIAPKVGDTGVSLRAPTWCRSRPRRLSVSPVTWFQNRDR